MIDSHIHVGQFFDLYFSPDTISSLMNKVGVSHFLVSSTTTCSERYSKVVREIVRTLNFSQGKALPVLWITPKMIDNHYLVKICREDIEWRCLKIHPQLSPDEWWSGPKYFGTVVGLAKELRCPVLIHTGEMPGCEAATFEPIIEKNQDISFILAHGRPFSQVPKLMNSYANVYVDTAFMPIENISSLCGLGFAQRVLWGTDVPIVKYYQPEVNLVNYYTSQLSLLRNRLLPQDFELVTDTNSRDLFHIL